VKRYHYILKPMRILLALWMLMTPLAAAPKILVHGHRGARAVLPENSIPAFEYAVKIGADVLELDMAVTKDDVVVISHDAEMNSKFCTGPEGSPKVIREMTLAQLQRWDCGGKQNPEFPKQKPVPGTRVPTLDEVFAATKGAPVQYNIETKIFPDKPNLTPTPEKFTALVLAVIRKHGLESRTIVQSFDPRTLVAMSRLEPKIRLSFLTPTGPMDAMKNWVEACAAAGNAKIISPHHMTVTKGRVEEAHRAGLQVVPWTANEPSQWQRLVDAEVDAIITDDPAALMEWLKSKRLR
jgi:glycerophosphoryl diester phosphodiesterase